MSESQPGLPVRIAVMVGAQGLFAPPAFIATNWTFEFLATVADLSLDPIGGLLGNLVALVTALWVATEISGWLLYTDGWFRRAGRRRKSGKIAVSLAVCVAALAWIGFLGATFASSTVVSASANSAVTAGLALAAGIALAAGAVHAGKTFLRGYRG